MNVEQRVVLMEKLGRYLVSDDAEWVRIKERASYGNPWFVPEFINYQLTHIATEFLDRSNLEKWVSKYDVRAVLPQKNVGIVMAGNIPLAGFHDFCQYSFQGTIKLSSLHPKISISSMVL